MKTPLYSIPMRYFLEVADCGSVNQAAERLFVAASAVSRQVGKLEDGLGVALFERRNRRMLLTPAGQRLQAHLRLGTDEAEVVLEQVRGLAEQALRQIRIACTEGFAAAFLPAAIAAFRQRHPQARFELTVASPDEVSALLARGAVDLGLKYSMAPEKGVQIEHSALAPVYAVMAPGHPLARRRVVGVVEVARYPLALGGAGVTARQLFDLGCSVAGVSYQPAVTSNFSSALLALVQGDDIVLSSHLTVAHLVAEGRLVAVPFEEAQLQQRRLQLMSALGRTLPPLAQVFTRDLVTAIERHGKRRIGRRTVAQKVARVP